MPNNSSHINISSLRILSTGMLKTRSLHCHNTATSKRIELYSSLPSQFMGGECSMRHMRTHAQYAQGS